MASTQEAARAFADAVAGAAEALRRVSAARKAVEGLGFVISEDDPTMITSREDRTTTLPERIEADIVELLNEAQEEKDLPAWAAERALRDAQIEIAVEEYRAALKALAASQSAASAAWRGLVDANRAQLGKPRAP